MPRANRAYVNKVFTWMLIFVFVSTILEPVYGQSPNISTVEIGQYGNPDKPELGRSIQIHVAGEVVYPGTYTLPANSRILKAIQKSGGINPKGSIRFVELKRGESVQLIDLFEFQREGSLDVLPYLRDDDVVFIPFKKSVLKVAGSVLSPGEYELHGEKTLQDAIEMAGGFAISTAYEKNLEIIDFKPNSDEKLISYVKNTPENLKSTLIKAGQIIVVPHILTAKLKLDYEINQLPNDSAYYLGDESSVYVLGGVRLPGRFTFNPNFTISKYVSLAGGQAKLATNKVVLTTTESKRIKTKISDLRQLQPGDTITVHERQIAPEFWISFFATLASLGLSSIAIFGLNN